MDNPTLNTLAHERARDEAQAILGGIAPATVDVARFTRVTTIFLAALFSNDETVAQLERIAIEWLLKRAMVPPAEGGPS